MEPIEMTQEEIIRAKTIGMIIEFRDICSNYNYLTQNDFELYNKYQNYKIYQNYLKYCVDK